jgi:signal transduction histidine kinase
MDRRARPSPLRGCERGTARIGIEDEGPGVPLDASAHIWEPFYRAASQAESTGGTGIGLGIVKQLVDLHHGRIRVERGSIGALFTIELPHASHVDSALERQKSAAAGA